MTLVETVSNFQGVEQAQRLRCGFVITLQHKVQADSVQLCDWDGDTGPCTQRGLLLGLLLCRRYLEMVDDLRPRDPTAAFCTGPHKVCSWSYVVCSTLCCQEKEVILPRILHSTPCPKGIWCRECFLIPLLGFILQNRTGLCRAPRLRRAC